MVEAYICDYVRTAIGRFGGALSSVRTDDLAAIPIKALKERNTGVDWEGINDVYLGCANQAGEDNRNIARMASLLAGLPIGVPGGTINRLCGSGMDSIICAARIPAFLDPFNATVATGTPPGICKIERMESHPSIEFLDFIGTPITGRLVIEATIPGR